MDRGSAGEHGLAEADVPEDGDEHEGKLARGQADHYCIRPVTPRGPTGADRVLFARGDRSTKGFTDFRTRIHHLGGAAPPV